VYVSLLVPPVANTNPHQDKRTKKWVVQTKVNGKRVHVGYFEDEEKAAQAYRDCLAEASRKEEENKMAAALAVAAAAAAPSTTTLPEGKGGQALLM
jgi:hypothetical protein